MIADESDWGGKRTLLSRPKREDCSNKKNVVDMYDMSYTLALT
jgi:hypothetical protein